MGSSLGRWMRSQREQGGLSRSEVVRRIGYRNLNKGCNRLVRLEQEGEGTRDFLIKAAQALRLDLGEVNRRVETEREERNRAWEKWADEPVPVQIIRRLMPGAYQLVPIPDVDFDRQEWEAYASRIARDCGMEICLALDRRHRSWIDESGHVFSRSETCPEFDEIPYARLAGGGPILRFDSGGQLSVRSF